MHEEGRKAEVISARVVDQSARAGDLNLGLILIEKILNFCCVLELSGRSVCSRALRASKQLQ